MCGAAGLSGWSAARCHWRLGRKGGDCYLQGHLNGRQSFTSSNQ